MVRFQNYLVGVLILEHSPKLKMFAFVRIFILAVEILYFRSIMHEI